jgi:hypothetical protein
MTAPSRMLPWPNTSRPMGSSHRDCAFNLVFGRPSSRAVFARELGCLGELDRLLCPRLRPQPQHIPVRILDLHLDGPRVVRRRHADGHAAGLQFRIDDCNVLNAEPDPCPTASLAAATQVDARAVAIHRREVVIAPRRIGESQNADLKAPAGLHVLYAQDGLAAFVMDARGPWIGHNNSSF